MLIYVDLKHIALPKLFYYLIVFIPFSLILPLFIKNNVLLFITAIFAIIPLAILMGFATKQISLQTNPTIGGIVSATFGNIIELIIAVLALRQGLLDVVKGSIVGSIIGNILLMIGLAILIGGLKYRNQKFNKEAIGVSSTMLIIIVVALVLPTAYNYFNPNDTDIILINNLVAGVMVLTYFSGLIFSLKTHKHLFDASDEIKATKEKPRINLKYAALILLITTIVSTFVAEILVGAIKESAIVLGITEMFIGIVIIAIITNIAEQTNAITFALENNLDLSLEIALSSAIQIALFVIPILIILSNLFNWGFLLIFSGFEMISLVLAVIIVNHLATDGKCNWLEGIQLISVYLLIAIMFFFI